MTITKAPNDLSGGYECCRPHCAREKAAAPRWAYALGGLEGGCCVRGPHLEGTLAAVRAQCKLWVYLGTLPVTIATIKRPPGKNTSDPEASGMHWQPKQNPQDRSCACNSAFPGVLWAVLGGGGGVHLGMVPRW